MTPSNIDNPDTFFTEILKSEVTTVRCHGCNTDQPMNKALLPYVRNGISSCGKCRNKPA